MNVIRLDRICSEYFGVGYDRAKQLAALNRLPVPAFRLYESERAPYVVDTRVWEEYLDTVSEQARSSWLASQV